MFEPTAWHGLFAVPPGADYPHALVEGFCLRLKDRPPESIARVTLVLNTSRMMRAVRSAFEARGSGFLPRLQLISDFGASLLAGPVPPVSTLRQRLEMAQLIRHLVERETDFAPGAGLFELADSLSKLLAEMHGEDVPAAALNKPDMVEGHAAHWERSLKFLNLAAQYHTRDGAPPDAELRQRQAVEMQIDMWTHHPPKHPVIIAGSTGSRGTTQLLMQAVMQLPLGAVILPGFDFHMPDSAWNSLDSGPFPAEDHPQFRFADLLGKLGKSPADVHSWFDGATSDRARNEVISLALRPAPITDQWLTEGARLGDLISATDGLTLIEAPTLRAEADAIALCLREAAEAGRHAVLVSPDRILVRRVTAALDRWKIIPDDSAGRPLALSAPGRFLREVAALCGRVLTVESLISLMKNPITATGGGARGDHLRFTRDLELKLRQKGPAFPTGEDLRQWANSYDDPSRQAWVEWILSSLDPVNTFQLSSVSAYVDTHLKVCADLSAGPGGSVDDSELWREEAGRLAKRVVDEIAALAEHGGDITAADYAGLLLQAMDAGGPVRQISGTHPLISIWGPQEARALGADLVVLGGLNEGTWPERPAPDPWLSRQMRQRAGLLLPERQIGLSAHDFQQAIASPRVVLTRSIRDGDGEAVISRWVARLVNLLGGLDRNNGPAALSAMRSRGHRYVKLAGAMAAPLQEHCQPPARRPAPRPPVDARPSKLSVTGIKTLIRDPYAIYAREILRLRPIRPMQPTPDPLVRGQVLHRVVEKFVRQHDSSASNEIAVAQLLRIADETFEADVAWPASRRLWRVRMARIAESFLAGETRRRDGGVPAILEKEGSVTLDNGSFTLVARPDRIDLLEDGRVHIYDYKSGAPPSKREQAAFDKQLYLEAAMAEIGGFDTLGPREAASVTYIQLGGAGDEKTYDLAPGQVAEIWADFQKLIAAYSRPHTGYVARRSLFKANQGLDYDHLARFGEWQIIDAPDGEDVG